MSYIVKQNFISWLQDKNIKKIHPSVCVDCIETVSDYAVKHGISKIPFWDITDYKQFNVIRNSLSCNRIFLFFKRRNAKNFSEAGKLYSDYLKEQAESMKNAPAPATVAETSITEEPTVKEGATPVQESKAEPSAEKNSAKKFVKHNTFGYGVITGIADGHYTIKFFGDSKDEREIAADFSHMYKITESEYNFAVNALLQNGGEEEQPSLQEPSTEPSAEVQAQPHEPSAEEPQENNEPETSVIQPFNTDKQTDFDYDAYLENFKQWLCDEKRLNRRTLESFISYFKTLNEYLIKRQLINKNLFLLNSAELASLSDILASDKLFQEYDHVLNNCLSVVLKFFCMYVKSGAADTRKNEGGTAAAPAEAQLKPQSQESNYNDYLADYKQWLTAKCGSSELTSRSYCSVLKTLDEELINRKITDKSLFMMNDSQINSVFDKVYNGNPYGLYNAQLQRLKNFCQYKTENNAEAVTISDSERLRISVFFNNSAVSDLFEKVFLYQKKSCSGIVLDVRPPIIGAKREGEKLRFYIGANGHIHFSHYTVDFVPYDKPFCEELFDEYCRVIDDNNIYFSNNTKKITLKQPKPSPSPVNILKEQEPAENNKETEGGRSPLFDIYEAVILHDGCIKVSAGVSRQFIISDISLKLRAKAINQGKKIDESYRNVNGITYQFACMQAAINGDSSTYKYTSLFEETANMYKQNREKYNALLSEARARCKVKPVNQADNKVSVRAEQMVLPQARSICPDNLKELITKKFPYGIRADYIALQKLRNYAADACIALSDNDDFLIRQIRAGGIEYEGKFYYIPDAVCEKLVQDIRSVFDMGVNVIYYDVYFDKNYDWMSENGLASSELIHTLLKNRVNKWYFGKKFFCSSSERCYENEAVEREFIRVWGDNVVRTYGELYELLPYIPEETIKHYLSRSKLFVWSSAETFAWTQKLIITEEEKQDIYNYVNDTCIANGFASISDIPLGSIEEENYQVSINAIYDAVYNLVLSGSFALNGKILNKNNSNIDALTLAKAYCNGKDKCTFEELNNYVISLNGSQDRQTALKAGYSQMVRVDENLFVADSLVNFDVDGIDSLLEQSISKDFIPIKGIATFALFPGCGYTWNSFVLESFCLKYSRKFRLYVINYNDKNAGIIAKSSLNMDYTDMLAAAAVNANVALDNEHVGRYLFENGYTAKSKLNLLDEVIKKAKELKGAD